MTNRDPGARDYLGGGPSRYPDHVTDSSPTAGGQDERSVGQIVGDIAQDLSNLMKQELELAKTEAKQEAVKAGKGAGMLAGAAVAGHIMLLFLSAALMFLLDNWMHTALAALIVGVLWGIGAAVLAIRGKKELQDVNPTLETTQQTLKEDVRWAKDMKNS